tara:strand:+ start:186 stop:641 length:456 start_codon:yes stop_codon:yes gene_type:complete
MNPDIWGPHAWFFLHSIAMAYPESPTEQDKEHIYEFFYNLQFVIPCEICKKNYKTHFVKFPLKNSYNTREEFEKWLVNIHNKVNKIHKKKQYTYEEVKDLYEKVYNNEIDYITKKTLWNNYYFWIIIILLSIIVKQNYNFLFKKIKSILYK